MKLTKKSRIATLGAISLSLAGVLAGCELIVDFDRTKIDGGTVEGGGGGDVVNMPDTSMPDTGVDGTMNMDTGVDGTMQQDTGIDTGVVDTGIDTGIDAPDDSG